MTLDQATKRATAFHMRVPGILAAVVLEALAHELVAVWKEGFQAGRAPREAGKIEKDGDNAWSIY